MIIACSIGDGLAEKRVALVVGNSAYASVSKLANPRNDAEAVSVALERLDFEVIKGLDLTNRQFEQKVRNFSKAIRGADIALLFYAGHGLQVGGRNYLAPVDTELLDETDLDFETVPLDMILRQMEREERTNLVFLDACRDNPLARNLALSMGTRSASVGRGLAAVETGIGTLISYATQPGNVALDGDGANSPFTTSLLKHIETPGEDIAVILRRVRAEVIANTQGKQVPWGNSSLTGKVVLKPEPVESAAGPAQADQPAGQNGASFEITYWNSIRGSNSIAYFETYLAQYPEGKFAPIARLKIEELQKPEVGEETRLATLEQPEPAIAPDPAPESKAEPAIDPKKDRELVRSIQLELNRLGCSAGRADGLWGRKTAGAVEAFARNGSVKLASLEPSASLLDELRGKNARVCPLVCGRGQEEKNGRCVAKSQTASVPPKSESTRTNQPSGGQSQTASQSPKPKRSTASRPDPTRYSFKLRKNLGSHGIMVVRDTEYGDLHCMYDWTNRVRRCRWE